MCWLALERGLALADLLQIDDALRSDWGEVRDEIRETIETRGWNEERGAFTQSFGSADLDASVLLMAISGFLPADDDRLTSTVDAIETELADERELIYRYRGDDGFTEPEGTFLLCTFWLAHALAVLDQPERARTVLDRAAGYATDLGLFAEQVDPSTGALWGNYPQAFSHLGFVNAAQAVVDAESRAARR